MGGGLAVWSKEVLGAGLNRKERGQKKGEINIAERWVREGEICG